MLRPVAKVAIAEAKHYRIAVSFAKISWATLDLQRNQAAGRRAITHQFDVAVDTHVVTELLPERMPVTFEGLPDGVNAQAFRVRGQACSDHEVVWNGGESNYAAGRLKRYA